MAHFYFQARQNNTRIQLVAQGSPVSVNLECSTDESNWSTWYKDTTLSSGQRLYLRGDNPDGFAQGDSNNYWNFQITSGSANIGGDIRSLVDVTMASSIVPVSYCFSRLFYICSGLVECADSVLSGFTTLANYCYNHMFDGCSGLITAPVLPAMTLTDHCYHYMFKWCSSLTTAPELPAPTVAGASYTSMFEGCTSLNYVKCLATDISAIYAVSSWLVNVSPTGTFVKNAAMNNWTRGGSGIPTGWNVYDDAPASITPSSVEYTGIPYESASTERPTITYSNIDISSVSAICPADWVTLDWVDSSTKTQLEIDIDDNYGAARTATITISGTDATGGTQTATITLAQEARPEGDIAVNPQTIHFAQDADGSSDKQSVYVSYTGFTSIGTVTATTDADWIEIEWRDDEVKNELYITPSENTGSSRQTIIVITGTDDYDNIITAYVVVKQAGVNINPIWRDLYYTGATDTFDYIIVNEDTLETIYQGRAYVQPNSTNVKVNISKIVQGYLNNEITDGNVLLNALYDDFNSQAVVDFGLYPVTGSTTGERIEKYTYYYDWSYNALEGNYVLTTPINGHATTTMRRMYTNISLEFDGYRNRANDSTLYDLSYCGDYALYYLQRNGGWASFLIEANTKKTDSYEKYSYNMSFDNTTAEFELGTYHNQITSDWEMHTGWLTDEQADNLAFNLLASNRVFLHDLKKDKIIPVIISNSDAEYKTFKNNSRQMVNYTITLTESQKKQLL